MEVLDRQAFRLSKEYRIPLTFGIPLHESFYNELGWTLKTPTIMEARRRWLATVRNMCPVATSVYHGLFGYEMEED